MATGATEFIDVTTADVFLEEVWSKKCTVARESNLVFAGAVDRQFEPEMRKGQILRIQNITNLAARAKSANTAITYETVTETEVTITIDQLYYAAFALEDVIKPMVEASKIDIYIPKLGYALALQEDDALAAHPDDFTNNVGTLTTEITYDNLVRGDQYLNDANVSAEGRFIAISPAQKAGFLKLDQFINKDYADIRNGILGSWMNYPIYVSTNVEGTNAAGHDNCMAHREAIALVTQIQPVVKSFWDIDYLTAKFAAVTTFGSAIRRNDHGVWLKGA